MRSDYKPSRRRTASLLLLILCLLVYGGCGSSDWVTLRERPSNPLSQQLNLFASGGPKPTSRTIQLLRRYNLEDDLKKPRLELLDKLNQIAKQEPSAEIVYAMAELAYLGGKQAEPHNPKLALDLLGASVLNSYLYLFDPALASTRNPYDPQYRGASNLYNSALETSLRILNANKVLKPGMTHRMVSCGKAIDVTVVARGNRWHNEDFDHFEFVSEYEVNGLRNHYRTHGLGVPLIAVRKAEKDPAPQQQFYPPNLSFPVTAFLRVVDCRKISGPGESGRARAVLELHDPLASRDIEVDDRLVPLESDLSTPLAFFLNQPEFDDSELSTTGLLFPDKVKSLQGLYMLEPYDAGKIPVVMVHGLWSSPVTWMEMYNDLRNDPWIRNHYQFWFYFYPTGQPFWYSASQMREDLARVRFTLDRHHQHPALDQMVLLGHSMGGLVSKLQTVESENRFWSSIANRPFREIKADDRTRNTLEKTHFFRPNPSIRRIVTIGTPHRGSDASNDITQWLGAKLITLPTNILKGRERLLEENPGAFKKESTLSVQTSIDSLSPNTPYLQELLSAPRNPWTRHHNIIGQLPKSDFLARFTQTGDGVVSMKSARLDYASSQIVVPAAHSDIHRHPRAILEVRRILLEHLGDLRSFPTAPQQHRQAYPVSTAQSP